MKVWIDISMSNPFSHQLSHPLSTFIEVEVEVNRNLSESRLRMGIRSCWSSSSSEDKMTTNWYICKPSSTSLNCKFTWSFDCAGKVILPQPYLMQPLALQETCYGTNMWTRSWQRAPLTDGWHNSLSSQTILGLNQAKVDGREKFEESLNNNTTVPI